MKLNPELISQILSRGAITFVFTVFGVWEVIQPMYWAAFVPAFVTALAPVTTLVTIHGIALTLIGIGMAVLKRRAFRIAAVLATLVMLEIVVSLLAVGHFPDILVRDVAILLLAASLALRK